MWDNVLPTLLGFVLTTVIGGLFASYLQQRSWRYQNAARLREEERRKASDVCQRITGLVDKRLYRMERLLSAVVDHASDHVTSDALNDRFHEYDEVLFEWNDQLNARLAVVGAYFGEDVRKFLKEVVYEAFTNAGQHLEILYREVSSAASMGLNDCAVGGAEAEIKRLNHFAYQLGVTMMVRVREERVGSTAPGAAGEESLIDTPGRRAES